MIRTLTFLLAMALPLLGWAEEPNSKQSKANRYASPTAVFEAYREARGSRDTRTCFSCLTPVMQDEVVFQTFFECAERNSKEDQALIKSQIDLSAANDDYEKRYKVKHGIDLPKVRAGHENDPKFVPPANDDGLLRDAVAAHVKDIPGFVEAAAKLSKERPVSPLGDLRDLVVQGDTATGHAKVTIVPNVAGGETPVKPGESPAVYDRPFKFRRVDGGWLINSL
jgi:hypothetical protein